MYVLERTRSEITVRGPSDYVKVLYPDSVGIVLRASVTWPYDELVAYTVHCADMTDAEIVGQALEINAYPV